jgi:hypothetical protein
MVAPAAVTVGLPSSDGDSMVEFALGAAQSLAQINE